METDVADKNKKEVFRLLSQHPEGMDINSISKTLNLDIRQVKPALNHLQQNNKVSSGLKKFEKDLTYFDRYYFALH